MGVTLLSLEDISQPDNTYFFQNALVSDLAVVQGVDVIHYETDKIFSSLTPYWLKDTQDNLCVVCLFGSNENKFNPITDTRNINPTVDTKASIRPVLPLSQIPHGIILKTKRYHQEKNKTYTIIKYGHYPQTIARDESLIEILDMMHSRALAFEGEYKKGRAGAYTFDKNAIENKDPRFQSLLNEVFELDGERYVCMTAKRNRTWRQNQEILNVQAGKNYWLKVEPIEWIINPAKNQAVSLKGLFSGIVFNESGMYDGCFEQTQMYRYLNNYFFQEMLQYQEESYNIHSMTEFKEALVSCFNEKDLQQYQNNRLGFYLSILKIAKETSEMSCYDGTLKEDMVIYAKNIVKQMTQDEKITPYQAIQQIKSEVMSEKKGMMFQKPQNEH